MAGDSIYRPVEADLSQGDIVDDVPHLRLTPPLTVVRQFNANKGRIHWAPFPYPPEEGNTPDAQRLGKTIVQQPFDVKKGEFLPVLARFTRAILLNYDCDLQHEEDHCLAAIVRPMAGVHQQDRQNIRDNKNFNYFYLPADKTHGIEEGYADFRQITCLDPALIETLGKRIASLTPTGVKGLQAQLFRFLTRRDLNPA